MLYGTQFGSEPSRNERQTGWSERGALRIRVENGVDRALTALQDEAVQRAAREVPLRVLRARVVVPVLRDCAADADHTAEPGVVEGILAATALDIAAPDQHGNGLIRRAGASDRRPLLRAQHRIVAIDVERLLTDELAAGRDLGGRLVVIEHQLCVDIGVLGELVMPQGAEAVARVGTLVVIGRPVVVQVVGGRTAGIRSCCRP